jgi:hypothetical protein
LHLPLLLQSLQLSIPADPPTCACPLVTFSLVKSELNCFGQCTNVCWVQNSWSHYWKSKKMKCMARLNL